jgi:hypothetical protein
MRDKPKRPWQNYAAFRAAICSRSSGSRAFFKENPNKWPCQYCQGVGKVVVPESLGVYEGRAEYYICPDCQGSRCGSQEHWRQKYKAGIAEYEAEIKEYRELVRLKKLALAKLSREEKEALKALGI